jgi:hypothetical protein
MVVPRESENGISPVWHSMSADEVIEKLETHMQSG